MSSWSIAGSDYFKVDLSGLEPKLESKIYTLSFHVQKGFYLTYVQDEFEFNYKVYNHDSPFVDRVVKAYNNTNKNLGILLNGESGSGKTVTAKTICNELDIPIILITHRFDHMTEWLNSIDQEVVIFIDEYEKIFDKHKDEMLTIMDGALGSSFKKLFIYTTNSLNVSSYLINRPSRIRYIKTYRNLELEIVEQILDDKLINKDLKKLCLEYISKLETITIDVINTIIDEVNIHNEAPTVFANVMNVTKLVTYFDIYKVDEEGVREKIPVGYHVVSDDFPFNQMLQNERVDFSATKYDGCVVTRVISEDTIEVLSNEYNYNTSEYENKHQVLTVVTHERRNAMFSRLAF